MYFPEKISQLLGISIIKVIPFLDSRFAAFCGICVALWTACLHQSFFENPTAISRQNVLHSLAVKSMWHIDDYHENTPDKAFANGHYYSDKAPGVSFLMLPFYWSGARILKALGHDLESKNAWFILSWICAATLLAPSLGIATWIAVKTLEKIYGQAIAWLTTGSVLLGGMPLIYSTVLFSHGLVVACLVVAACCLRVFGGEDGPDKKDLVIAGFCLGTALASEYTSGLTVVALSCWGVWKLKLKAFKCISIGAAVPLASIAFYSWKTIGHSLQLPYSYQASFPGMQEGLYGIRLPSLKLAWILLFSPERGLFFWSPVLLTALVGFGFLFRARPKLTLFCYGCILVQVVVMSGREFEWLAGVSFGPRYLAPILSFFIPAVAEAARRHGKVVAALGALGIAMAGFAVLTHPMSYGERDPFREVLLNAFLDGKLAPTVWSLLGLSRGDGFIVHYSLLLAFTAGLYLLAVWRTQTSDVANNNCAQEVNNMCDKSSLMTV